MHEKNFSQRLSELRLEKGVSAREMSLALGQNSGYINHIENQQTFPSLPVFFNICEYLNISPEQFFSTDTTYTPLMASIIRNLEQLNEEQLNSISILTHDLAEHNKTKEKGLPKNR